MPIDDEIPEDISALLRDARTEVPPAGAKDRVWARTMAQIDGPAPSPAPSSSTAAASAASAVRMAAVAGFGAGVLAGVMGTLTAVTMLVAAPEPKVVYVEVPGAVTTVAVLATPVPTPKIKTTSTTVAVLATPDSTAAERATERAWLDAARTALGRGDFDSAMDALETARQRFPNGTLSEEREAIGVHVLIARGDKIAARLAADTFKKQYKGSLFLLAIEEALQELKKGP